MEFYLKSELAKFGLVTDFEYAIYDCETDAMVYGDYISFDNSDKTTTTRSFPKQTNLVYYFAIRFPEKTTLVYSSLWLWVVFSVVMFFVLVIYSYSAFKLLQQKKYSELQRDFINNMTHEFKTPLSSILLSSNFLARQPIIEEDDKMRKYTGIIIEQAGKLNDHVEKVLHLAKAESNLFKINKTTLDPELVINEVIENVRLKYPGAFIGFNSSITGKKINADTFHFANLVYNLLDNSIKYSTSAPRVTIDLSEQAKNLILSVKDEGAGISKKDLEHIFDKFYRVPAKSNDVAGFGLGLFYVKKICEAHKWKITAASELQKGTTITVIMPGNYE